MRKGILLIGLSVLAAIFLLCPLPAKAFSFPDFKDIHSVTYYPYPQNWSSPAFLENFSREIPKMKAAGFNAVWIVVPWVQLEPVALPSAQYNQAALDNVKSAVSLLEQNDMVAIMSLDYGGKGWIPQGIEWWKLFLDNQMWGAFYLHAARMASELGDNQNVLFLVHSEGYEMTTNEVRVLCRADPQVLEYFHNWVYGVNPNLSYWNLRWGTSYTSWTDVMPVPPSGTNESVTWLRWVDQGHWASYILRGTLGTTAGIVKKWGNPNVKIGFHDIILPNSDDAEPPVPDNHQFDIYSYGDYPDPKISTNSSYWIGQLQLKQSRISAKFPSLPIFTGEFGLESGKWTTEQQEDVFPAVLSYLKSQGMGFNVWAWKDFSSAPDSFGMLDVSGNEKPMFKAIKPILRAYAHSDLNQDGSVNSADFDILKSSWNSASKPPADLNQDGIVNSVDLGIMMSQWG